MQSIGGDRKDRPGAAGRQRKTGRQIEVESERKAEPASERKMGHGWESERRTEPGSERKMGHGCDSQRKAEPASDRESERGGARGVELRDGVWHVSDYAAARRVLRNSAATRQAGFNAEQVSNLGLRQPVLFQDGDAHKQQRVATARFFTPKTVDERYRSLMERLTEELVGEFERQGRGDLDRMSLALAVQVASQVVGLTESRRPGLARRLERLLSLERFERVSRLRRFVGTLRSHAGMLAFFVNDVRPAVRARRKERRSDVISHLLDQGYGPAEILIECITYGAAGMATTREFISMAAWHLLEDDGLRREYLRSDEPERHRILQEILRLEPVVGRLYRRTVAPLELHEGDEASAIPAGSLVALEIRQANADEAAVGSEPLRICPHRELAPTVQPPVLSFGDGPHRCPGAFIAIQESDIFLRRLLALPVEVESPPRLGWNDLIEGYELRDFRLRLASRA